MPNPEHNRRNDARGCEGEPNGAAHIPTHDRATQPGRPDKHSHRGDHQANDPPSAEFLFGRLNHRLAKHEPGMPQELRNAQDGVCGPERDQRSAGDCDHVGDS
jgi:hypothetical protein